MEMPNLTLFYMLKSSYIIAYTVALIGLQESGMDFYHLWKLVRHK